MSIIEFLSDMPFWYWFALAGVLLILEIFSGSTYLLWPSAAAALVGVLDMGPMDGMWEWQLAIFALVTILLTIFVTPYARDWVQNQPTDSENLNRRGAQQIGRVVHAHGDFVDGSGKVKVDDTVWLAKLEGATSANQNEELVVTATKGATLLVRKA